MTAIELTAIVRPSLDAGDLLAAVREILRDPPPELRELVPVSSPPSLRWERITRSGNTPSPSSLPAPDCRLVLPSQFRLIFADDVTLITFPTWGDWLHHRVLWRQTLDGIAAFNRSFAATDCLITANTHPMVETLREGTALAAGLALLPAGQGEVAGVEDLDHTSHGLLGYWRFDEEVIPPTLPRPWPPVPRYEPPPVEEPAELPEAINPKELGDLTFQLLWETRRVQRRAAEALGNLGPRARGGTPELVQGLTRSHPDVRFATIEMFRKIGDPSARDALKRCAQTDEDARVCQEAWMAWAELAPDPAAAFTELFGIALVQSGFLDRILTRLEELGPRAAGARQGLLFLLAQGPGLGTRFRAANLIAVIGPTVEMIPGLCQALRDGDYRVRHAVARALVPLGELAGSAAGELIESWLREAPEFDMEADQLASATAWALAAIGPETSLLLCDALRDRAWQRRARAAELLGRMRLRSVIPDLAVLLEDPDDAVRYHTAVALTRLDSDLPELIEYWVGELDCGMKWNAIQWLAELGRRAAPALPALRLAIEGADEYSRPGIEWAIRRIERLFLASRLH